MQSQKGFSLIELVITLAVVAVVSSMVMSFSGAFLQDNRISTANNDLIGSINLARSTAVSNGARASICASNDGATCTSTAWELGWLVFTDSGTAGVVDGTDKIIKVSTNAAIDISITNPGAYIQFKSQGRVASVCTTCLDKTIAQRMESVFVAALNYFNPISSAYASGSSGSSGSSSGSSGNSGSSGGSGGVTQNCVAPDSQVTAGSGSSGSSSSSGSSGSSSSSGSSGDSSASLEVDKLFAILSQLSPIASAYASGSSGSSGNSGSSGGSGSSGSSGTSATCDDGGAGTGASAGAGGGVSAQVAILDSEFLICDSSRSAENGRLIAISPVGRVTRDKVSCN